MGPARNRAVTAALIVLAPSFAFAHTGIGDTTGFVHGLSHPLGGLDHVLPMLAVGLFAAHLGGRAIWLVPLSFVTVMALGGALGVAGVKVPLVEIGIGLSVVFLGLAIAFQLSLPTFAAMALVAVFAVFHGHAHGAEMPDTASGLTYGAGFVCATALLHAVGVGLWLAIGFAGASPRIVQAGGGVMALAGVAILGGVL
jgi:urease accessory protein